MADANSVEELAGLVGWTYGGVEGIDWVQVEEAIGLALPASFKEYVARFPAGEFQTFIDIEQPRSASDVEGYAERVEEHLTVLRVAAGRSPGNSYDVFPRLPGLFPWGNVGMDYYFCWHIRGSSESHSAVIVDMADGRTFDLPGTIVDPLIEILNGRVPELQYIAEESYPPRFDPLLIDEAALGYYYDDYLLVGRDRRPEVPFEEADRVDEVAALARVFRSPEVVDWQAEEAQFRHPLPRDYKQFIDTVGPGRYGDIFVASLRGPQGDYPGAPSVNDDDHIYRGRVLGLTYNASIQIRRGLSDAALHPVVWGEAHGWYCGWMPGDYPTDLRPVLIFRPGHRGQAYPQSMTGYLAAHLRDPVAWKESLWRIGEPD